MSGKIIDFFPQKKKEPVCSFCKKPKHKNNSLIGEEGRAYICYNCLKKCNFLLTKED